MSDVNAVCPECHLEISDYKCPACGIEWANLPDVEEKLKKAIRAEVFDYPGKTFYNACYLTLTVEPRQVVKLFSRTYEDFTGRKFRKQTNYDKLCSTEAEAQAALLAYCKVKVGEAAAELDRWTTKYNSL